MEKLKSIGSMLLGIVIFIGIIVSAILFFTFGAKVAFTILPIISWITGILLALNLIALLVAISRKARGVVGIFIYISSYIYGLQTWLAGFAVTLVFWGWFAVIVGVIMGGVGVVPIGMLAAIFHSRWDIFLLLLFDLILTYGSRVTGAVLAESAEMAEA